MKRLATLALTTAAAVLIASGPTPASATDVDVSRALRADQTTAAVVSGLTIGSTSEGSVIRDGAIQMTLKDSSITPSSQGVSSSSHTYNATPRAAFGSGRHSQRRSTRRIHRGTLGSRCRGSPCSNPLRGARLEACTDAGNR